MHLLLTISTIFGCAFAFPQYGPPPSSYGPPASQPSNGGGYGGGCLEGQVLNVDGNCVTPVVTRSLFVYNAPPVAPAYVPPPVIPTPKVDYNVVFVKTPERPKEPEPIVVPPAQQKTIVYVLNKQGEVQGQRIIEIPAGPKHSPEVYYINYDEGDNPQLPGGLRLQEALTSVNAQQGQHLPGGGGGGVGNGGGSGFGGNIESVYAAPLASNSLYG